MPDISMCANKTCHLRAMCYRARATPSERQSYAEFKPEADGTCHRFSQLSPLEQRLFEERDKLETAVTI